MRSALLLAARGRGAVEPNPMVGCVIVKDGRVIGEGFHRRFGAAHAEPDALAHCIESPAGATVYVNLEPCCHTGKKTPPCVPRLIEAQVARVVVACLDPNPQVSGKGAAQLRSAGIDVTVGVLEAEAQQLNAPFFALIRHGRPYVTLKWAQTANGKIAAPPGQKQLWISNKASQRIVHEFRARCDAILVGLNTVVRDDPSLTVRGIAPMRPLIRVVLDSSLRIPLTSRLVQTARQTPVLVICDEPHLKMATKLTSQGVQVVGLPTSSAGEIDLNLALKELGRRGVTHLLVEPGPTVARGFFNAGFVDRIWVFHSSTQVDEPGCGEAPQVPYAQTATARVEDDQLTEYLNPASDVYFRSMPSVDFQLIEPLTPEIHDSPRSRGDRGENKRKQDV